MSDDNVKDFPTRHHTPKGFYEQGLSRAEDMKAVGAVVFWTDGTITTGWSKCSSSELALMRTVFAFNTEKEICDET